MLIVSLIAIAICTALLYFNIDFRRNAEHRNNANYVIDFATILAIVPFQQARVCLYARSEWRGFVVEERTA